MTKKQTSLKPLVEIRSSDFNSVAFKEMDFEGGTSLMLTVESSGESASFFFEDAHELKLFAKRVIEAADSFI